MAVLASAGAAARTVGPVWLPTVLPVLGVARLKAAVPLRPTAGPGPVGLKAPGVVPSVVSALRPFAGVGVEETLVTDAVEVLPQEAMVAAPTVQGAVGGAATGTGAVIATGGA